ncbi:hypothetical protein CALCODRAFT_310059 [Calocera cornea HHB12733]|uniref:DUF6533 domain-containing protein n=1 Tax=Calocera cornea HHB12733 TaxID=1353952 RepID=A0A165FEJ7_9BASI|nr:hypothetical protein CALCODRAFT_310059 [Calocera cornea HHB12733]
MAALEPGGDYNPLYTYDPFALQWQGHLQIASIELVTFDILILLPKEVLLIWTSRRCRAPTVLYFLTRYAALLHSTVAFTFGPVFDQNPPQVSDPTSTGEDSTIMSLTLSFALYWSQISSWSIPFVTLLSEGIVDFIISLREAYQPVQLYSL